MKERMVRISIDTLYTNARVKLSIPNDIKAEVTSIYQNLMGSCADNLANIDLNVMR